MIFRYSIPTFSVCAPFVQVTESLMMNVGRVVMLPTLTPALLPNCSNPSLKSICGGTLYPATPAIFGKSSTKLLVHRAVPLVAVQVAHRHVVQQRAAEGAVPVEPADPRVLRVGVGFVGDRLRQHRHELGRRALVPDAREDVVAVPDLQVEAAHVVVGVAENRVRNRRPEIVVEGAVAASASAALPATAAPAELMRLGQMTLGVLPSQPMN